MQLLPMNTIETTFEVETSIEGMTNMINQMHAAIANASRGQVLRMKIAPNITLVIRELGIKQRKDAEKT